MNFKKDLPVTNASIHFLRFGVQVDFLNDVRPSFNNEFGVNLRSNSTNPLIHFFRDGVQVDLLNCI